MVIKFDKSNFYSSNIVELCYKNSNGKKIKYSINSADTKEFNDENIIFDLIVKDHIFKKKQIILYFIFLLLFFPIAIFSSILPTAAYKKFRFEIDSDIKINFIDGNPSFIYENKDEIIKCIVNKYDFIFLLFSLLWLLTIFLFITLMCSLLK